MDTQGYNFQPKSNKYRVRGTRCANGQSAPEAAIEMFGPYAVVGSSLNAMHFDPHPADLERWGDPIGTVTVHGPNTTYYVFRRNPVGRPSLDVERHNITITRSLWQKAEQIGGGNASDGIRKALEEWTA
jgi:hypothetical protein